MSTLPPCQQSCLKSNPPTWYDPTTHPTIFIATLALPAPLLLISAAMTLLLFKLRQQLKINTATTEIREPNPKIFPIPEFNHQPPPLPQQPPIRTLRALLRLSIILFPLLLLLSFYLSNYLTSCIPRRPLLFSLPSTPPTWNSAAFFGGVVYLWVWILMSIPGLLKGDRDPRRALRRLRETFVCEGVFAMEAVGLLMVEERGVWGGLRVGLGM
ncbi:hypothetical protein DOTSEDRAFT_22786 [Dothistroma septosporum NZE10]|uniref:Uncharacterized protein n=1 Tax=Dothistroma septosporum (strain NZE10 / CBS 128990) TaxID=675120 RepID=N1PTP9_DOTSN|nr:hypothetical protein DOTSEDRAFT_22786 [Dothistroma septosporum NZE10]